VPVLLLVFIIVPIVELAIIIQIGSQVGVLTTVVLLVAVSVIGAWLVKFQGLGVLNRIRRGLARGELPATELVNGGLILFAGALMLTPGFLTDAVGLALLLPPVRAVVRPALAKRFRAQTGGVGFGPSGSRLDGGPYYETTTSDEEDPRQ